jgi:RimJ/RimL family protein N-acetyltransferase
MRKKGTGVNNEPAGKQGRLPVSDGIPPLASERLSYRPLAAHNVDAFHSLIVDEHVRRYLLDGHTMDRDWSAAQLAASDALFAERRVGLWLASLASEPSKPIAFCGFIRFDETGPEPQLLYALTAEHAGRGYATEMARALVDYVRHKTSATQIISAVDEPNVASSRVLAKVGFAQTGNSPGALGRMLHYRLSIR